MLVSVTHVRGEGWLAQSWTLPVPLSLSLYYSMLCSPLRASGSPTSDCQLAQSPLAPHRLCTLRRRRALPCRQRVGSLRSKKQLNM